MGVDVASFGDYFADKRGPPETRVAAVSLGDKSKSVDPAKPAVEITTQETSTTVSEPRSLPSKRGRSVDEPIKCLVYNDPFGSTYKKYIFTADGKHLLGGMMIGDVGDFVKLVAIVKKKVGIVILSY